MRKIIQLLSLLILLSCSNSSNLDLQSNPTIESVFNESEIQDLSRILNFFNDQICSIQEVDRADLKYCYKSYFERLKRTEESGGDIELNIPYNKQQELYTKINKSTFDEIWNFGKTYNRRSPDTLKFMSLNYNGKYVKFLKEFSRENETMKYYYEQFEDAGCISPNLVASLLWGYEYYDISDIRMQLVVAIHYLTLNDNYKRKEKY